MTAIPYLFAIAGLWLNAQAADRDSRYSLHVLLSMVMSTAIVLAVALLLAGLVMLTVRDRARAGGTVHTAAEAAERQA